MQQILITISPAGEVKVEAQGVVGSGCAALTRAVEQAMGKTVADQKKGEFFQQQPQEAKAGYGK